ncbi:hypothetical protein [Chryseobacterium sp.]|uniref:hypothetical protein n=1 Tax=Chryseobacterium sp. TaxID=1871047 RepID=UPI0028978EC0|nr:hypothetical protein [Chryseobacterium sp.]
MNKTLLDYINELLTAKNQNGNLAGLTSASKTSIWRQIIEAVAFVIFNFQEACRLHMTEIETKIREQKIPSLRWYRNEALRFQYGFEIDPDSLTGEFLPYYQDNGQQIPATDEIIEASKIIQYAAVTRNISNGKARISMKIAGENIDEALSDEKAMAFKNFIEEIQAAGDNIVIVNYLPDILLLKYVICIDPMIILPDSGMSIITGRYPVRDAIEVFLKNLPFNGEFDVQKFEAAILAVSGVTSLLKQEASSKWIEAGGAGYGLFQPIEISRIPKSGRFKIEDWNGITYQNYTPSE